MTWNAWTLACLLLATGTPSGDVWHLNSTKFQIPIRIQPGRRQEIKELKLFASRDQGKTWELVAVATPDKDAFTYFAPGDGLYWFSVAVVDQKGQQEPRDLTQASVGQKIVVDTAKPTVRIELAERQGENLLLRWDAKDPNAEPGTLKVEFKGESTGGAWLPVESASGLSGQTTFKVGAGPVSVRVAVQDLAGNVGQAQQEVSALLQGTVPLPQLANSAPPPPPAAGRTTVPTPQLPLPMPMPNPSTLSPSTANLPAVPPPAGRSSPTPVTVSNLGGSSLPPLTAKSTPPAPARPSTAELDPFEPTPPARPSVGQQSGSRSIALSPSRSSETGTEVQEVAPRSALPPARGALASLQIVNKRQVKLDFEVNKFGPSGLGSVDVWVTTDDGQTWEKMPGDPNLTLPGGELRELGPVKGSVTVPLAREGTIYGFSLVVKSRAGLGKAPPQRGDQPQIRVELDATMPEAELYSPQADPGRRDTLLLTWKAQDRNLTTEPISLEWADRRDGPWQPIGPSQLPNSGRYNWQVPSTVPPSVYLRLSVRDTAGNVAVAQTSEPILVDLAVPEVSAISLSAGR